MAIDLEKLEALAKAATPAPWTADNWSRVWHEPEPGVRRTVADCVRVTVKSAKRHRANAAYIAAMHEALPELIAENRTLQERVRELEAENAMLKDRVALLGGARLDFPNLRASVAGIDNSLSVFLADSIKRAAAKEAGE